MPIILVFDTETTGLPTSKILNPEVFELWPYIIQFSYIMYDTDKCKIIKQFDKIIRLPDGIMVSTGSLQIHGINNEKSRSCGVALNVVLEEFYEDIKAVDVLVGHNVSFDTNMVKIELLRLIEDKIYTDEQIRLCKDILYQFTYISKFRCTMNETKDLVNILTKNKRGETYVKFPTLAELYKKLYGGVPKHLHNSLHDVLITLICFVKFEYKYDVVKKCVEINNTVAQLELI
jgi:DNA polymerase III epsilon subunit-like protein